jgi:hypothetical protein
MANAVPQIGWIASIMATTAIAQSASVTATNITVLGWEAEIPVQLTWKSTVSADGVINAFPSSDGGTHYDTNPAFSISIARTAGSVTQQTSIRVPTGIWALQVLMSGPSSGSVAINTAQVISAITIA